jgi:parallel beta helix pectate lyase-like protein
MHSLIAALSGLAGVLATVQAANAGVGPSPCPANAIAIAAGAAIQEAVDRAGDNAVLCLKNGVHRAQAIRPHSGQRIYGEGRTVLNGSWLLTDFTRQGSHWTAKVRLPLRRKHGECLPSAPFCSYPERVFIDDRPLTRVAAEAELASGTFLIDRAEGLIHLADDPTHRKVEVAVALFAFESAAANVSIGNVIVEKFANAAQKGAIHAREGVGWTIENCEVRLNSGGGIGVGSGSLVRGCDIHDNGQIGLGGHGRSIRVEHNHIWSNNIYGFDGTWEAGGAKIALSEDVTFRGNHVHDNNGPGLWCDIDCRHVLYEENLVEGNQDIGIFHEISFDAVIRNNVLRHNGLGQRGWFWGSDIVLAASEKVEVRGNELTVAPGRCGIVLIDQGRRDNGKRYKTSNNTVHANEMTFDDAACAGGVSDQKPGAENFGIIGDGNNLFDGNTYRVRQPGLAARFVWGQVITDWNGFRRRGQERSGQMVSH